MGRHAHLEGRYRRFDTIDPGGGNRIILRRVIAARDFGITEFLSKPVSAKALHARLVALVERPRPFVRVGRDYFGPDRRRAANESYSGAERRAPEDYADLG